MGADLVKPEEAVRAYFAAYSQKHPERFDEIVSPDYVDYGHTAPGHGPQGVRDDYEPGPGIFRTVRTSAASACTESSTGGSPRPATLSSVRCRVEVGA
jgi:SnoaL-like domain